MLLEAAKALAGREPLTAYGEVSSCIHCRAVRISPYDFQPVTEHLSWCPWLQTPQIVAALEILQEIANGGETPDASLARRGMEG